MPPTACVPTSAPLLSDNRGVLPGAPHPLGIRPWGSLLFASERRDASCDGDVDVADAASGGGGGGSAARPQKKKRPRLASPPRDPRLGLGDLRRLPDAALLLIVASLPAEGLAAVSCVSRALYAFAFSAADGGVEDEEGERVQEGGGGAGDRPEAREKRRRGIGGWRSATLSDFGGAWAWGGTWARTYAAAAWARKEEERAEGKGRDEKDQGARGERGSGHASFVAACERALARRLPRSSPRLRVPLFSDALYETWAATAADPGPWLARDTLPRVAAAALSPEDFARRFDAPALPVVLVGAARHWPALERWQSDDYLLRVLSGEEEEGGREREGQGGEGGEGGEGRGGPRRFDTVHAGGVEVSWGHFAAYAATNADDSPLTVFDSRVLSRMGRLRADLGAGAPECLPAAQEDADAAGAGGDGGEEGNGAAAAAAAAPTAAAAAAPTAAAAAAAAAAASAPARERDLFSVLPRHLRPDHEWLIAGGRRSGSGFHIDPNATSAWNAVVRGAKKWVLFPPGRAPPGVEPSADLSEVIAPAALADWFRGFYEEAFGEEGGAEEEEPGGGGDGGRKRRRRQGGQRAAAAPSLAPGLRHRPLEGIVSAGDAIFVPRGWWHAVLNLETPTIAVTTNFVSRAGLAQALRWVRSRDTSLVSGVRGDEARLRLAQRWEEALRERAPEALAEAEERIAREDAAAEARRSGERALASLFREEGGGGGGKGNEGGEAAAAAAAPSSSSATAAAAPARGGFSFNFAVED